MCAGGGGGGGGSVGDAQPLRHRWKEGGRKDTPTSPPTHTCCNG